jgi:hypothetical protein
MLMNAVLPLFVAGHWADTGNGICAPLRDGRSAEHKSREREPKWSNPQQSPNAVHSRHPRCTHYGGGLALFARGELSQNAYVLDLEPCDIMPQTNWRQSNKHEGSVMRPRRNRV